MKKLHLFVPLFLVFVITICAVSPVITKSEDISKKVFRLHIVANSNSQADQTLKLRVRDKVLDYSKELYKSCNSSLEATEITNNNIQSIKKLAQNTVAFNGYSYPVYAYTANEYFNTRKYEGFTLPAGKYDCLKIIIGNGNGKNWWCVMFPSVCINASTDELDRALTPEERKMIESRGYAVRFKAVEIYEYLKAKADR